MTKERGGIMGTLFRMGLLLQFGLHHAVQPFLGLH